MFFTSHRSLGINSSHAVKARQTTSRACEIVLKADQLSGIHFECKHFAQRFGRLKQPIK